MKISVDGEMIELPSGGPQGPAGPDGNPIGAVISFMGTSAPKDYLICDGSEYSVSQYPALAAFFQTQFGTKNHFGGDGTTTFAVPDMRNLFLRGYHGEAEEQLSGEVGEMQEATRHIRVEGFSGRLFIAGDQTADTRPANPDSTFLFESPRVVSANGGTMDTSVFTTYSSRPVNMAVLYCIKAVESVPAENMHSTEETRIGTWIDGKPLYRNVLEKDATFSNRMGYVTLDPSFADKNLLFSEGVIGPFGDVDSSGWDASYNIPFTEFESNSTVKLHFALGSSGGALWLYYVNAFYNTTGTHAPVKVSVYYTKTTD